MSAARTEPFKRPKPTHTFWPASHRPEPPAASTPHPSADRKDEEHQRDDEPGYGHGV